MHVDDDGSDSARGVLPLEEALEIAKRIITERLSRLKQANSSEIMLIGGDGSSSNRSSRRNGDSKDKGRIYMIYYLSYIYCLY